MEKLVIPELYRSAYSGKRVFVTGHTGFKGSWLTAWLLQLGATVKGYALPPDTTPNHYSVLKLEDHCESVLNDIRHYTSLEKEILEFKPEFIFHLAAQPLVKRSYKIPAETFEVNVVGTANVLQALRLLKIRCTVIIVTTDKVYENIEQDVLYKESDRLGGYDPYSASKACTEIVTSSFRDSFFNLKEVSSHEKAICTARAGNVIGGGDFSEDRIVPDIIKALIHDQKVQVRNPWAIRPWQHVLEPVSGYLLSGIKLLEDPVRYSGAYNFGPEVSDHLLVKQLVETSIELWGSGGWVDSSSNSQVHEAGILQLDITKAKEVLGWKPKLKAQQSIEWTINWYKENENERKDLTMKQIQNYMAL